VFKTGLENIPPLSIIQIVHWLPSVPDLGFSRPKALLNMHLHCQVESGQELPINSPEIMLKKSLPLYKFCILVMLFPLP